MPRPRDEEVFARDHFRCVYCDFDGSSFDSWQFLTVDHFKPRSRGGDDDMANLMTACAICNNMKNYFGWPTLAEARAEIGQWRDQMRRDWEQHVQPRVLG